MVCLGIVVKGAAASDTKHRAINTLTYTPWVWVDNIELSNCRYPMATADDDEPFVTGRSNPYDVRSSASTVDDPVYDIGGVGTATPGSASRGNDYATARAVGDHVYDISSGMVPSEDTHTDSDETYALASSWTPASESNAASNEDDDTYALATFGEEPDA